MRLAQRGIILVTSLLICLIISLLVLCNLQQIGMVIQLFNQQYSQRQLSISATNTLHYLMKNSAINPACLVAAKAVNYYPQQLLTTDVAHCHLVSNNITFNYIIEDMGQIPCLMTANRAAQHFYRINLLAQNALTSIILQGVFTTEDDFVVNPCQSKIQIITLGNQSWRLISEKT